MFRRGCLLKSTFSVKLAFLHQNKFVEERGRAAEKAPFEAIIWENLRIQQRGLLRVCFCEKLLHCSFLHKSWEPFLWREKQERNRGIFCFHHVNVIQLGWTELCDVKVEIIRAKCSSLIWQFCLAGIIPWFSLIFPIWSQWALVNTSLC